MQSEQQQQQQRILGYFIEEAREHLNTIEQGLLELQSTLNDPEMINEVFRAAHSIKGGAAMLGLTSIQQTSHRLEDCFKVLREHPVKVDQKLESLFLAVSDTLKALLDHLSSSFGLSEETANSLMSETEPIFAELNQYLEIALNSVENTNTLSTQEQLPQEEVVSPEQPETPLVVSKNLDLSEFQNQVLQCLREMLQLFKQSCTSTSRANLQQCCQKLVKLGEEFNCLNWSQLCQSASKAIGNTDNSYLTLAKIIITEIKQAQELVIQGREAEIIISQELEALEPIPEIELLEIIKLDQEVDEQPQLLIESVEAVNDLNLNDLNLADTEAITLEPMLELDLEIDTGDSSFDNLPEIQLIDTNANAINLDSLLTDENQVGNLIDNDDLHGPEVGIAELNTLEDLFKGENEELDETWQQEQIVDTTINQLGINNNQVEDSDYDLTDLLALDTDASIEDLERSSNDITDDLDRLFGTEFLGTENLGQSAITTPATSEISDLADVELSSDDSREDLPVSSSDLPTSVEATTLPIMSNADPDGVETNILDLNLTENQSFLPQESTVEINNFDELLTNINAESLEEISIEELPLTLNHTQPETLSLDYLLDELGADITPTTENLEIGDLFALPVNTTAEVDADDFNSFWNQIETPPIEKIAAESGQDAIKELEESLFAASGETVTDDQPSDAGLDFYLGDFDFTVNQPAETREPQLIANIEDDLFADFTDSQSTHTLDSELSLPEIYSFSQEPETLDFMAEFTNQSAQTSSDLQLDVDDLFASFGDSSHENLSISLENEKEIQPIADLPDIIEQPLNTDLELDVETEAVTTDSSNQADITQIAANNLQPELELTAAEAVDNSEDLSEFAELEVLLERETTNSNPDAIPEDDLAALEALLNTDNLQAEALPQEVVKVNQPVARESENVDVSLEIPDEFKDLEDLLAEADQTINTPARGGKSTTSKTPRPAIRRIREESMKIPVKQLDDMSNLVGELVVNRNTLEQNQERLRQSLDNLLIQIQHLSDVGTKMEELYERSLLEASLLSSRRNREQGRLGNANHPHDRGFSELEMDHFTLFHELAQETIEHIVRIRESGSDIDFVTEETERVGRQFRQVTTQLQEGLTKARMVPFAQVIDRLRRGVRDNGIKYGKQVELVTEGTDTPIDKMILDHLTNPLTHMLNNAIAHGIETPEVRKAAGKPTAGTISIRAFHQGNQTVIAVTDDGAGIDHEKVKQKALQKGVITSEEAQNMTRQNAYELLFMPSFSTADEIDDIKGRGVGMNIVQNDINEIRGTVSTDSTLGKGTSFTIRLPFTLSICKALCCISNKARIAFPMDGVEDTLDISITDIQKDAEGQTFISWRDTVLPFRPLQEILAFNRQIARGNIYGTTRDDDMISVVVLRSANTMVAIQIDQVLSEQEIFIKQFEGPAPKPSGVAGATVLGDGRIMPIADVLEIIDIFQGKMSKQIGGSWQRKAAPPVIEVPDVKIDPTVLIVDDSITVRELLSLTFTKAGYRVEQARDGQEAWDKLRSGLPCDIVFCDIEMPRCDGLELLSRIHKDSSLNQLPIAMLTSRGADKHRQMALELGASGYFTKPYLEEALLEAASRMLKGEKLMTA